jgi:hypothetical protein
MPLFNGSDRYGYYWQWGSHGHKYYYNPNNIKSQKEAKHRAILQWVAARYNGYRGTLDD